MRLKVAAFLALAAGFWLPQVQAGVNVGSTRVVYQSKKKEANLVLSNSGDDGVPYLVQSWVSPFDNRDASADEFIVTPPCFAWMPKARIFCGSLPPMHRTCPAIKKVCFYSM